MSIKVKTSGINLKAAALQLAIVTGKKKPRVQFQIFDDRGERDDVARTFFGTLEEVASRLKVAERNGCGIFFTVNESDGKGRRRGNIKRARAVFADLDGAPLPKSFPIDPDLIVQSSPGKWHLYWAILPTDDLNQWSDVQARIAAYYCGDRLIDPPRVLRLAGTMHTKGKPVRVRIVKAVDPAEVADDGFSRRTLAEIADAHPCEYVSPAARAEGGRSQEPEGGWDAPSDVARAKDFLADAPASLQGEGGNNNAFRVAARLRDFGVSLGTAIELAEDWNSRCEPPWSEAELERVFRNAYEYAQNSAGTNSVEGDFANDLPEMESESIARDDSPIAKLNRRFVAVMNGSKFAIFSLATDPERPSHKVWRVLAPESFEKWLANRPRLESGNSSVPLAKAWMESPQRRSATGTTIDPSAKPGAILGANSEDEGALNLWTGWGLTPKKGKWDRFREMILADLCRGSEAQSEYLLNWLAWKIQNPGKQVDVAVVIKGKKGSGKTTLGDVMVKIFGAHGIALSDQEQFLGRFTGHLAQTCFLFVDEGMWAGKKSDEGKLKTLITSEAITREAKFQDAVFVRNRIGLMMVGNEKWIVPATIEERRFLILETSEKHIVPRGAGADHPKRRYWNELYTELNSGGREAFFFDMLKRDLGGWHPRENVPQTQAMAETIVETMRGAQRWWYESLIRGELGVDDIRDDGNTLIEWDEEALRVRPRKLTEAYLDWLRANRSHESCSERALLAELKPFGVTLGRSKDPRHWIVPDLETARAAFEKEVGGSLFERDSE